MYFTESKKVLSRNHESSDMEKEEKALLNSGKHLQHLKEIYSYLTPTRRQVLLHNIITN